jgi:putative flippase GtrA
MPVSWLAPVSQSTFVRYALVATCGLFLDCALLAVLHESLHLTLLLANLVSFLGGLMSCFVLHRSWTFRGRTRRSVASSAVLFVSAACGALCLNEVGLWFMISVGVSWMPAKLAAAAGVAALNYSFNAMITFGTSTGVWSHQRPDDKRQT